MELAIPLVALGSLYIVSNHNNENENENTGNTNVREGFTEIEQSNNKVEIEKPVKRVTFAPSESNSEPKKLFDNYDSKMKFFDG